MRTTLAFSFALALGCGASSHHGHHGEACDEIASSCHDADEGGGLPHECHVNAHGTWTGEECTANRDACLAACTGAPAAH